MGQAPGGAYHNWFGAPFACVANEDIEAHRSAAKAAEAVILSEGEVARREQLAYYRGWQDGKQYYLDRFGGTS